MSPGANRVGAGLLTLPVALLAVGWFVFIAFISAVTGQSISDDGNCHHPNTLLAAFTFVVGTLGALGGGFAALRLIWYAAGRTTSLRSAGIGFAVLVTSFIICYAAAALAGRDVTQGECDTAVPSLRA